LIFFVLNARITRIISRTLFAAVTPPWEKAGTFSAMPASITPPYIIITIDIVEIIENGHLAASRQIFF
jgi:hypothetical protein